MNEKLAVERTAVNNTIPKRQLGSFVKKIQSRHHTVTEQSALVAATTFSPVQSSLCSIYIDVLVSKDS